MKSLYTIKLAEQYAGDCTRYFTSRGVGVGFTPQRALKNAQKMKREHERMEQDNHAYEMAGQSILVETILFKNGKEVFRDLKM